jgi:CRISPR/Cas system-associated exonuclease Cas4 (RecB family)
VFERDRSAQTFGCASDDCEPKARTRLAVRSRTAEEMAKQVYAIRIANPGTAIANANNHVLPLEIDRKVDGGPLSIPDRIADEIADRFA